MRFGILSPSRRLTFSRLGVLATLILTLSVAGSTTRAWGYQDDTKSGTAATAEADDKSASDSGAAQDSTADQEEAASNEDANSSVAKEQDQSKENGKESAEKESGADAEDTDKSDAKAKDDEPALKNAKESSDQGEGDKEKEKSGAEKKGSASKPKEASKRDSKKSDKDQENSEDADKKEAGDAKAGAAATGQGSALLNIALVAAIFILPLVVAQWLSRRLRMPEQSLRIAVSVFAILLCVVVLSRGRPRQGIDLRGGVILVYQLAESETSVDMDRLIVALTRRVNPGGIKEISIKSKGQNEIEIIVPEATKAELDQLIDILGRTGALEFRILASRQFDDRHIIEPAMAMPPNEHEYYDTNEEGESEIFAKWIPVTSTYADNIAQDGNLVTRFNERQKLVEVLVKFDDGYNVSGEYLRSASVGRDNTGHPSVSFLFDGRGKKLFGGLTGQNAPNAAGHRRHLAVVLDGFVQTAPTIRERIEDRGEIEGQFTEEEASSIAAVLTAGSLPASVNPRPNSQQVVGPTLGRDTIELGVRSMLISTIVVVIFMVIYYRFAGIVANLALILNVALIVAFMILFKGAFTLAGLAGLALTVGMAVDANVLIYERMREETERGSSLKMAIRNGFDRATGTIIDANVTTLISAVVLYAIGTDQVKGFAITLILGLIVNLFTAITFSRLIFDVAEKRRWISRLSMLKFMGKTNFDFLGRRVIAVAFSIFMIAAGIVGIIARGSSLLDIDFTGGVAVESVFKDHIEIADIRDKCKDLSDLTVQDLRGSDPADLGKRYLITTSESEIETVESALQKAFPKQLATNHVTFGQPVIVDRGAAGARDAEDEKGAASATNSLSTMKFALDVSHEQANKIVEAAIIKAGHKLADVPYSLDNANHTPGSRALQSEWEVTAKLIPQELSHVLEIVNQQLEAQPYFPSSSIVGSAVAAATQNTAAVALAVSLILILAYVWFRFTQVSFGFAAVVAVIHDVFVALGALALSSFVAPYLGFLGVQPFKIGLPVIAAFLTIIGYSLNDTIVIMDRIREIRGKSPVISASLINDAVNQTLSRTLLTSLTVLLVVVVLYAFGGQGIHAFSFALVIGTISGTYSTIYIASPILLWTQRSGSASGKVPAVVRSTQPTPSRA